MDFGGSAQKDRWKYAGECKTYVETVRRGGRLGKKKARAHAKQQGLRTAGGNEHRPNLS